MFEHSLQLYLIVADYHSKYPFVYKLPSTESTTINCCLKSLFAEQSVQVILRSDIGPQFSSNNFRKFADEYGFRHVSSSPHYQQSNIFIESPVKIVKKSLTKAKKSGLNPALAMLCLRTTSCSCPAMSSHHANRREVEVASGTTIRTPASGQPPTSSREKRR